MYQEPELNVEEKSNASVNKRLYKLLIIILRYTPVVLSINDILHQSIIKGCDEILQQLNPEIIEKQRQEQENKALREEINSLKEMFKEFINTSLKQEKHGNNN